MGESIRGEMNMRVKCNTCESEISHTTPVKRYKEGLSPYGCLDMAGNVCEWTDSWYDEVKEDFKVLRGGSWFNNRYIAHCANRYRFNPGDRDDDIGFRCAMTL